MKKIFAFSLILIFLQSCSDPDDNPYPDSVCDQITEVNNIKFLNTTSEGFEIYSVELTGDCLEVQIASHGCGGETWEVDLLDAGNILESKPEQRDLKVLLKNEELCNANVFRTYTFDLRPVRTENNVVLLNLVGWEEQIRYEY